MAATNRHPWPFLSIPTMSERWTGLMNERAELDADWPGELEDPEPTAKRAAWDAGPRGQELARLYARLSQLQRQGHVDYNGSKWCPK